MKFTIDQDGVKHMPKALCTYADHSYPAYTKEQMRMVLEQRDELLAALKLARAEFDKLPRSLGYEFDYIAAIDAAIYKATK